jgi:DNA polymerase-3 subunit gamma/tau
LASTFGPDEIQLFYQIALHGRNEMHLAPDEYAGFTMALMRMLAFAPIEATSARPGGADAATRTRGRCDSARSAAVKVRSATAGRCAIKRSGTFRW